MRVDIAWNTAVKPEQVTEALEAALADGPDRGDYCRRTTKPARASPLLVAAIAAAVRAISPDTLVLVDAVSSLAGIPIAI
jgi:aspartate aminotransferase-like enzyme